MRPLLLEEHLQTDIRSRRKRNEAMKRSDIYHSDPDILGGTPVFVGTRVPIQTLLDYLKQDKRIADFRDDFPTVSEKQAEALLELAAHDLLAVA